MVVQAAVVVVKTHPIQLLVQVQVVKETTVVSVVAAQTSVVEVAVVLVV
jgi:hypothetical protein